MNPPYFPIRDPPNSKPQIRKLRVIPISLPYLFPEMQREPEELAHRRMTEHRLFLERDLRLQRDRAAAASNSFSQSLRSIRSQAEETLANREKLTKLKDHLKELEADLGKTLAVKTCKDAKSTTIAESLATTTTRIEQLKSIVQDQRTRKNEHEAVISQQLFALETLEGKSNKYITEREKIDKAIMWYWRVLGFRTEGGDGVKFIFNKIDPENPDEEYSFTIRLDGDIYTLLHCDPHMEDTGGLVKDLNKSNELFKFVRIMREKFKSSVLNGVVPTKTSVTQDSMSVSSPPPTSIGSCSETLIHQNVSDLQPNLNLCNPQKGIHGQIATPSPQSLSSLRRSPRLRVKKFD